MASHKWEAETNKKPVSFSTVDKHQSKSFWSRVISARWEKNQRRTKEFILNGSRK